MANGTNYGLTKMANISDRSFDHLRNTQANFLWLETLQEANDRISNCTAGLPIFRYYDIQEDKMHASCDGQKFECRLNTFKARYSSKYFGKQQGVSTVTLVANHVPINAKVIGANEHESHFIFDLLYNNSSEIKPDILSTDNHGTNHVNFALLDLFGYTFAPRYANFNKVIDGLFSVYPDSEGRLINLKKPIRKQAIINDWDIIQRICVSLKKKNTTQSTIIRKLSSYKKNNHVLNVLSEYDRVIKCLYVLDYIDDMSLRQYVQRALNRGEAYHQLRRAVSSVNGNRFRGGSDVEVSLWDECARLITNSIVYFNSLILSKLLQRFEAKGNSEIVEAIKQVSPVAWTHINLNGTYSFSMDGNEFDLEEFLEGWEL